MHLTTLLAIFFIGLISGYCLHAPLARARARYQQRRFKPQLIKRYRRATDAGVSGSEL